MEPASNVFHPPEAPTRRRHSPLTYGLRRFLTALSMAIILVFGYYVVTFGLALTNRGDGVSYVTRAETWASAHGLARVSNWMQSEEYRLHPPVVSGTPPAGSFGSGTPPTKKVLAGHLRAPLTLSSPAGFPLAGEGEWHAIGRKGEGEEPGAYVAYIRPDKVHTSYVDAVVWMDPSLLSAALYNAGTTSGSTSLSAPITSNAATSLVAAFDAGMPLATNGGGLYSNGVSVAPLKTGAASVVVSKDGDIAVGAWGSDVTMSSQVSSVVQNLDLIVDAGKAVSGLATDAGDRWSNALAATDYTWRSGIGVTRSGAVLYVAGPGLSLADLAHIFVLAGATRAMELDVGADWVQFSDFTGQANAPLAAVNGSSIIASMTGTPLRYYSSWWTRDFFTVSLRVAATKKVASKS